MFSLEHGLPQGVRTTARLWLLSASHLLGCPHPHRKYSTSPPSGTPHESVFKGSLFNQVTYKMYMALIWKALNQYVFNGSGLSDSQPQSQGIAYRVVMKFSTKAAGDLKKHFGSQCTITHFGVMTTKLWHFGFFPNFFLSAFQSGHSVQRPPMNSRNMVAVSAHSLESYQNQWHVHHSHFFFIISTILSTKTTHELWEHDGQCTITHFGVKLEPKVQGFHFLIFEPIFKFRSHCLLIMSFSAKTTNGLKEHCHSQCTITLELSKPWYLHPPSSHHINDIQHKDHSWTRGTWLRPVYNHSHRS